MLGVRNYDQSYIDACRTKIDRDIAAFDQLGTVNPDFEATYFNNLVLVLEQLFVHRLRTVEGKNGNALNESRMLANSLMVNAGIFTADPSIKLNPAKSALNLQFGDTIALTRTAFATLAAAFFTEIQAKFGPDV